MHSGSAIRSSSGHIHDVPEVRSGSVSLSQLRSDSRDSLSKVVQYSNHALKLPSPPVAANRSSVSDGAGVSSAQSLSRSSGTVSNSSALSSRQTVGSHYSRENSSSMRRESAERTRRYTTTRTTTEEKKCTVMWFHLSLKTFFNNVFRLSFINVHIAILWCIIKPCILSLLLIMRKNELCIVLGVCKGGYD